jgi:hypothetical protein
MKYRRRGFEEARAEALRIAEEFIAVTAPKRAGWAWEVAPPEPDELAPNFDRRKPIVKWLVWIKLTSLDGGGMDGGDAWVLVDLETKEARWAEWDDMRKR